MGHGTESHTYVWKAGNQAIRPRSLDMRTNVLNSSAWLLAFVFTLRSAHSACSMNLLGREDHRPLLLLPRGVRRPDASDLAGQLVSGPRAKSHHGLTCHFHYLLDCAMCFYTLCKPAVSGNCIRSGHEAAPGEEEADHDECPTLKE